MSDLINCCDSNAWLEGDTGSTAKNPLTTVIKYDVGKL